MQGPTLKLDTFTWFLVTNMIFTLWIVLWELRSFSFAIFYFCSCSGSFCWLSALLFAECCSVGVFFLVKKSGSLTIWIVYASSYWQLIWLWSCWVAYITRMDEFCQGAGLENLGNTCFLNSVLQCLTYTEPLAAYLQSGKHQNSCEFLCHLTRRILHANYMLNWTLNSTILNVCVPSSLYIY